jgi:hypothetical protein
MAGEDANYQLERAAGMVKDWSARCATADQDVILDDIIEILRRAHAMPRTFDIDDLATSIADWCITAYGPPLYEFKETTEPEPEAEEGRETPTPTPPTPARPTPRNDHVPLDILEAALAAGGRTDA